jgi:hypothetical protein
MKCCACDKELDVDRNVIPPEWYGCYAGQKLDKVICAACIKTPEGRRKYGIEERKERTE